MIDLGDADVIPEVGGDSAAAQDHTPPATNEGEKPEACEKCGLLELRPDGTCPDCEPVKP